MFSNFQFKNLPNLKLDYNIQEYEGFVELSQLLPQLKIQLSETETVSAKLLYILETIILFTLITFVNNNHPLPYICEFNSRTYYNSHNFPIFTFTLPLE